MQIVEVRAVLKDATVVSQALPVAHIVRRVGGHVLWPVCGPPRDPDPSGASDRGRQITGDVEQACRLQPERLVKCRIRRDACEPDSKLRKMVIVRRCRAIRNKFAQI